MEPHPTWRSPRAVDGPRSPALVPGLLLILGGVFGCGRGVQPSPPAGELRAPAPPAVAAKLASLSQPTDGPAEAAELYRMKRQVHDGGPQDPLARLEAARAERAAMRLYSSRLGRELDPDEARLKAELASWQPLGPGNVGGRIRALLIHPERPATMWTAGVSGGIWKTTDGGGRWRPVADALINIAVSSMAMSPGDPDVLYAGTGEGFLREVVRGTSLPLRGAGIFKSVDGGESWARLPATAGADFHWVNDLAVSPLAPARVYAATRSGVWRSADAGASWQRILASHAEGGCLDLALRNDRPTDVLLVACGTLAPGAIWRSKAAEGDAGFVQVLAEEGMARTSLAIAPSQQGTVYALSASHLGGPGGRFNGGLHAVFRSDQGGEEGTWRATVRSSDPTKLNTLLLTNPVIANLLECGLSGGNSYSTLGWHTNTIAVDPTDPEVVWAGGVDLFRSDDGGESWGVVSYWWASPPSAHADQHAIRFDPRYDPVTFPRLYLAGDGGIFRSDNPRARKAIGELATCDDANSAVAWTSLNHNLGVTQFYHGAPLPDGGAFLGGTQDNGTILGRDGRPDGWAGILGGDGGYVAVDPTDPRILYAESQNLNLMKSVDGGATFQPARNGLNEPGSDVLFITPFVMDPSDPRRLWTGGRRIWRTVDGAASWSQASPPLDPGGKVSALAVSPADGDRVLVGLSNGWIYRHGDALSAGATSVWPAARPRPGFVSWLAFAPDDPRVAYATYAGFGGAHVWRSTDGGATWQARDGSGGDRLPDVPVHAIVVDPAEPGRLFLGTDLGVFVSTDDGGSWAVENTGFAAAVTESLALLQTEGGSQLYAFTHGRGAWRVAVRTGDPGTLALAPGAPPRVTERAAAVAIEVRRLGGTRGAVSVRYRTEDDTATAGADYATVEGRLDWSDGESTPRTVTVPILDDREVEGDERFRLVLADPAGGAGLGNATVAVTLLDNDVVPEPCVADARTLCLAGRFRVEAEWQDFDGGTGVGWVAPLAAEDSGVLWFFGPDRWELLVKALDGCGVNDRFWVFFAATTDVAYTLSVTDTVAGEVRRWPNPLGVASPTVAETDAFATCAVAPAAEAPAPRSRPALTGPVSGACAPDGLCLLEDRFAVEVEWEDFEERRGHARARPERTGESGLLWFFDADNVEMLVKVIDGCGLNDRFWVFAAATTNVAYTLRVTDRATGAVREYGNALGERPAALTDTDAFATCGEPAG